MFLIYVTVQQSWEGAVLVSKWVNYTKSYKDPGSCILVMPLYSMPDLQSHLRQERKRVKDYMPRPRCNVHQRCAHSTHHSPVTGLLPTAKKLGNAAARGRKEGCYIHSPVSRRRYLVVRGSLWLLSSSHVLYQIREIIYVDLFSN